MLALNLARAAAALLLSLAAMGCAGERAAADADRPAGIDPAMLERRSDGLWIPSQDSLRKTPGYVIDSVFTPEENLRRFQATVAAPADNRVSGGAPTTDALLRRYWALLAAGDTLAMTPLIVSRAEYAYLYFPESVEGASGMPPAVGWELIVRQSGRGLTRALFQAQRGPSTVVRTLCSDEPRTMGKSILYGPCGVVIRRDGSEETLWIVKSLLERDGVHKLLGLQNELPGTGS
jgi:hypothetical protein